MPPANGVEVKYIRLHPRNRREVEHEFHSNLYLARNIDNHTEMKLGG